MKDTHVLAAGCGIALIAIVCVFIGAAADRPALREPTPLEADTFAHLKKKFSGEILTADLKPLHAVGESEAYKKFLAKTHSEPAMPQAFAEIVNASVSVGDHTLYTRLPPPKTLSSLLHGALRGPNTKRSNGC